MFKAALTAALLRVCGTVLWLLFTMVCARTLSVEDFGFVFFSVNVIITGGVVAALGYDVTVLRYGSRYEKAGRKSAVRKLLSEARLVVVSGGLLVIAGFVILTVLRVDTPVTQDVSVAGLVGLSIVATALMAVNRDVLRACGKLSQALLGQSVLRTFVPLLMTIGALLFTELTPMEVLVFYLVGLLTSLAWEQACIARLGLGSQGEPGQNHHAKMAFSVWPGEASLIIFHRACGIVIGLTSGLEAAAFFIAAERVSQLGVFLSDAVRTAIAPIIAQARSDQEIQAAIAKSSILMLLSGGIGFVLLLAGGWLLLLCFGREYLQSFPILCVLLVGQLSWTMLGPTALIMNMQGLERVRSLVTMIATAGLLICLIFTKSAFTAGLVFAVICWVMNGALWYLIRARLGAVSGVFGVRFSDVRAVFSDGDEITGKLRKSLRIANFRS
ncbi:oligosaccharide flippase family protein [Ruegeria arenilitoris]|uniref:oligosaccharide flippase family protein n=1 Tax=Ruegeria arenilitoris TaxID=1173585 RepID=UPI00147A33F4|nr:oligosaccharide flippase family protein [Ruegeria arenilitoris]